MRMLQMDQDIEKLADTPFNAMEKTASPIICVAGHA
jgi:hypothetical protein